MVRHWLGCPVNGYLGSSYGADVASLLHQPLSSQAADRFLDKLRADVPILASLPRDQVNLLSQEVPPDGLLIYVEVMGNVVLVDQQPQALPQTTPL